MVIQISHNLINLKGRQVIAQGNRQFVFEHPNAPDTLLKIPQPQTMDENSNLLSDTWFDRIFRRATVFKGFLREFHESFELMARHQKCVAIIPVCEVRGIVQTDMGLALMYERISDPNDQLSPNLQELIHSGHFTQAHLDSLNKHFDLLIEERVIISNQNPKNIVYQTLKDGSGRWVWIDSFGCKQAVPLRRWSKRLNRRKIEQIRQKFCGLGKASLRQV